MSDIKIIVPKTENTWLGDPGRSVPQEPRQWKLMAASLLLLLVALGIVLWHDRDFWFPDSPEAEEADEVEVAPAAKAAPIQPPSSVAVTKPAAKPKHTVAATKAQPPPVAAPTPPPVAATRTVLPPLEVEVVAGDTHRTIRPGSGSSVHVDLQPGAPTRPVTDPGGAGDTETAARVTSDAAERVGMSTGTSQIVTHSVRPNYPLLARQMKVQGSVILVALIGKDGIIQNLRVLSGPQILAGAAQDAVRQWHFKPHLEGSEAVETEAKITVNFTISTN
jgi:protein TonB